MSKRPSIKKALYYDTVEPISTGWDWFQKPDSKTLEDKIPIYRIGAIPDNSCFYHSLATALVPTYQEEKKVLTYWRLNRGLPSSHAASSQLYVARQTFVDNFRRSIVQWLRRTATNPRTGAIYSEEEAKRVLTDQPWFRISRASSSDGASRIQDPTHVTFGDWRGNVTLGEGDRPIGWAYRYLQDLVAEDEKENHPRADAIQWLYENTVNRSLDSESAEQLRQYLRQVRDGQSAEDQRSDAGLQEIKDAAIAASRWTSPEQISEVLLTKEIDPATYRKMSGDLVDALLPLFRRRVVATALGLPVDTPSRQVMDHYNLVASDPDNSAALQERMSDPEILRQAYYDRSDAIIGSIFFTLAREQKEGDPIKTALTEANLAVLDSKKKLQPNPALLAELLPIEQNPQEALRKILTSAEAFASKLRRLAIRIYDLFGRPDALRFGAYPRDVIATAAQRREDFAILMGNSVDAAPATPVTAGAGVASRYFTPERIEAILSEDPRSGMIEDPRLLELPLNINYFMLDNGTLIERYPTVVTDAPKYSLFELIRVIGPYIDAQGKVPLHSALRELPRFDAGEDDFLPISALMFRINVILVQVYSNYIGVNRVYGGGRDNQYDNQAPSVVINWTGGHFECLGTLEEGGSLERKIELREGGPPSDKKKSLKTVFEPNHPFIRAIQEYRDLDSRLKATGDGKTVYDTLTVSRRPIPPPAPFTPPRRPPSLHPGVTPLSFTEEEQIAIAISESQGVPAHLAREQVLARRPLRAGLPILRASPARRLELPSLPTPGGRGSVIPPPSMLGLPGVSAGGLNIPGLTPLSGASPSMVGLPGLTPLSGSSPSVGGLPGLPVPASPSMVGLPTPSVGGLPGLPTPSVATPSSLPGLPGNITPRTFGAPPPS